MELLSVRLEESPHATGRVRLVGEVAYDDRPETELYWFEFDERSAGTPSLSGSPWLSALLPLAVTLGQNLRIGPPVDPLLADNAPTIMEIWRTWYRKRFPHLRPITIQVTRETAPPPSGEREAGAFFSGGIDSFYTVLHNAGLEDRAVFPRIDRLLWVGGFDLPLDAPAEEFRRLRSRLDAAANELGRGFLEVMTNIRTTRYREASWGHLSHGCAMAAVGLALERRFATLYIAATYEGVVPIRPWGSHPETDSLLSTRATRFLQDGLGIRRSEKTAFVARSDVAMRTLHVCWRSGSAENCCECRKCLLAMLTLDVLGVLERCPAFSKRPDLDRVRRLYLRGPAYMRLYKDIEARARRAGRRDIVKAIRACRRRYRFVKPLVELRGWLQGKRGLWRVARVLRPAVLEGPVR